MEKKKTAGKTVILYVLNLIKVYATKEAPISQSAIAAYLSEIGVACDRKTVGRNISYLQDFGYPIKKVYGKGFYLDFDEMKKSSNPLIV